MFTFNSKKTLILFAAICVAAFSNLAFAQQGFIATPSTLNFSGTPVGTTSATQTVTLSSSDTRAVNGFALNLTVPRPFVRGAGTCVDTTVVLPCTIGIAFAPTTVGLANSSATATITPSSVSIALNGTGVQAGPTPALNKLGVLALILSLAGAAIFFIRR